MDTKYDDDTPTPTPAPTKALALALALTLTLPRYDADNKPLARAAPDVESFMRDDLRIQCGSPEHDDAVSLAYL
jgi:hypothetical protein